VRPAPGLITGSLPEKGQPDLLQCLQKALGIAST
jgi:hypothetical protein